ncbi:WD-40 repeat-containing protein [Multifurca ochricompacta]|uniref:methylated diphthine methylhydrolase n=1 Tax=Multifurca ochricompacta TaxID=376703 RepID=A0AAD4MGS1_9AGAM|nr:WD-40 repeat-containing protein [Multifurca ochricompacta]
MHLSIDTVLPADSVEFCPHPNASNVLVCGTYKLEDRQNFQENEKPVSSIRRGQCLVYEVHSEQDIKVSKTQEISLPAILDLKWCHTASNCQPLLAVADAEGSVSLFQWDFEQKQLRSASSLRVAPSHVLCLSLDWSNRKVPTSVAGSLVVSLSDGKLALLKPDQTGQLLITSVWPAHTHEPWCVAWNYWDDNLIYSGGDDLQLKAWDIRQGFERPTFDAGVTCIQSHPYIEHLLAVGSYDSTVRLFDVRKPLTPLTQAEVGGGAWRVKWHPSPSRVYDLLVAAMHDGFKIVSFHMEHELMAPSNKAGESWEIQKRYDEHKSLAYGVDWSYQLRQSQPGQTLIASASFYDHALHLWQG